ncbi:MAG TPA: DUF433 domain-containing protein [Gemmataceae bacterium]|nr:DUF433 domain-containing protein [Gemmataceae bacterium]
MVNATPQDLLGIGLYTPAEAALYARVATGMMNRWIFGDIRGEAVVHRELAGKEDKVVTFLDFVQAMAVRAIRVQHKVSLQKIRQALDRAENEYGVPYPFARKHTTFLFQSDIIIKVGEQDGEPEYVQITGKHARNRMLTKVVELYMLDLSFEGTGGLASLYRAWNWNGHDILMNPKVRFGEPIVVSCGYTAQALWDAYSSEGSLASAAEAYGVKAEEVEAACRYYDHLIGNSAA